VGIGNGLRDLNQWFIMAFGGTTMGSTISLAGSLTALLTSRRLARASKSLGSRHGGYWHWRRYTMVEAGLRQRGISAESGYRS